MSQINSTIINENFPLAGVDNDTQVFRDNFSAIKNNFAFAKTEIEALDTRTTGLILTATSDGIGGSDFGGRTVRNALFSNNSEKAFFGGSSVSGPTEISFTNGTYQYLSLSGNATFSFTGFPTNGYARIRLEIAADGVARTITLSTSGGVVFKKNSSFPGTLTVTSSENPIIIDVWKRPGGSAIFMEYKGLFT